MRIFRDATRGLLLTGALALGTMACDVDQTREARMPDVDVSAESGQLPKYKVEKTQEGKLPDVDVSARGGQMPEFDVDTADVDVKTEKREIEVPTGIEVRMPEEDEPDDEPIS